MNGWENFAGQLVGMVIAGAAVYGGIRSDLKHMAQGIERAESSARRAHARIDALFRSPRGPSGQSRAAR